MILCSAFLLMLFLFSAGYPWFYKQFEHEPFGVKYSPDRHFRLEVYAVPFLPLKPYCLIPEWKACSGCAGYVRLINNKDATILHEKYVKTAYGGLDGIVRGVSWKKNKLLLYDANYFIEGAEGPLRAPHIYAEWILPYE